MRKLISILLVIMFLFIPASGFAEGEDWDYCPHAPKGVIESPSPSITLEDLYATAGPVDIVWNSKFDYMAMVKPFAEERTVEVIPIIMWLVDSYETYGTFFWLQMPAQEMTCNCFIINSDCEIIGNVDYEYRECEYCGDWWYDVSIQVAPGHYEPESVVYLVWVE